MTLFLRKFIKDKPFGLFDMPFVVSTLPFVRNTPLMEEKCALIEHLQTSAMRVPRVQIANIDHRFWPATIQKEVAHSMRGSFSMLHHKICFSSLFLSAGLMVLSATDLPAREMQNASVDVHTADLNLGSEQGRTVLEARITHAVNQICGDSHSRSTWDQQNYANCSKQARADVQARVDAVIAAADNARRMAGDRTVPVR